MTTTSSRAKNRRSPPLTAPPQSLPAAEVRRQRIALAREMILLVVRDGLPAEGQALALQAMTVLDALARAVKQR